MVKPSEGLTFLTFQGHSKVSMKMAKRFLSSARLSKSLLQTRSSPPAPPHIQVTHFSHHSYPFANFNTHHNHVFLNSYHQNSNLSSSSSTSVPDSVVKLITTKDWSVELENELEEFHPTLAYQTVMYVLKGLESTPKKALAFFNWVYDNKHNGAKPNPMVYNLMLRILSNKETLDEFAEFFKRLEEEDCCVENSTYLSVMRNLTTEPKKIMRVANAWKSVYQKINVTDDIVRNVVGVIIESDSMVDMKKKLGEVEVTLTETFVLRILWSWQIKKNPLKALWFFCWLKEGMAYTHNAVTYNAVLQLICRKELIEEFWSVVEEMRSEGYDIDIDTCEKIVKKLESNKMTKDAVKLYDLMMDSPCKPLDQDFSPFLRDVSLTLKGYEETRKAESKEAYDQIYKSLICVHRFDEAKQVLKTMSGAGYEPDGITYSQGVLQLRIAGRLEDAMELLNEMESKGYALHRRSWSASIQAHCKSGESDEALKSLTGILAMDSKVGKKTLENVVDCLCNNGRGGVAYNTVAEVVDKQNVRPSLSTFKKLIEELLKEKKLEEATSLLRLMKKHEYPAYRDPYVEYISKFGTVDDAVEFLKELIPLTDASCTSCKRVFESFFKEGRESEAMELFDKAPQQIHKSKSIIDYFTAEKGKETQHHTGEKESIVDLFS